MSSWSPTKYQTKNWPSYNAALKRRGSLSIWFDLEMVWVPPPSGKRGRQLQFSNAAIQTCLTLKVLFGMPLRQTTGFVASLLRMVGLDWAVPDFSTLCRRQRTLDVKLPYRGGAGPLSLLIDSTGIKSDGEGNLRVKANGTPASMVTRSVGFGARYTSGSTKKHWRFGPLRSRPAISATRRCYLSCWTKSLPIKTSAASPQTGPTTRANAMMRLPPVALMRSYPRARMPNRGSPRAQVPSHATMQSKPRAIWAEPSGSAGADITAVAASRPKCIASSFSANP